MGLKSAIIRATIGPEGTYSAAEQVVLNMTQPRLPGKDIAGFLKGRGVKEEEIRELGLDELMSEKSVSREELLDKIQENRITFEEKVYTGGGQEQEVTYVEDTASLTEAYNPEILEGEIEFIREYGPLKDNIAGDPEPRGFMGDITPEIREWAEGTREFENLDGIDQDRLNTIAKRMVEINYQENPSRILRLQADGQEVNGISLIREGGEDAEDFFVPAPDADIDLRRAMGFLRPDEIERDKELEIPIREPNYSLRSPEEAAVWLRNFGTENGYLNLGLGDARWAGEGFNLPGGSNYREIRLSLPGALKFKESVHFPDDQNNVFHVRLTDRVDNEGRNVLFVEEAQSDWAQTIRKPDKLTEREARYEGYLSSDVGKPRGLQETMVQSPELIDKGKQTIADSLEISGAQEELDAFWRRVADKEEKFTTEQKIDVPSWAVDLWDASNPSVDILKKPSLLAKFLRDYYRQEGEITGKQLRNLITKNTPIEKKIEVARYEIDGANARVNTITPVYKYPDPNTKEGQFDIDILFDEYIRRRQNFHHNDPTSYTQRIQPLADELDKILFDDTGEAYKLLRRARVNAGHAMREDLAKMGLHPAFADSVSESIEAIEPGYVGRIRFEAEKPQTAPFIRDTQAWNKLMIKRLVRLAEEEGYDGVAFSTGDVQYERWPRTNDGRDNIGIKQQYDVNIPKAIKQVTKVKPSRTTITISGDDMGSYEDFEHTGPFIDLSVKTPDGETIGEQARRGYTTFSMAGPATAAAAGLAGLAAPDMAQAGEVPIDEGIGRLPRSSGEERGILEELGDFMRYAPEVGLDALNAITVRPLAGSIAGRGAFDLGMSPEAVREAQSRAESLLDYEASPGAEAYGQRIMGGIADLLESDAAKKAAPYVTPALEALEQASERFTSDIIGLNERLYGDDDDERTDALLEVIRPGIEAIQPI